MTDPREDALAKAREALTYALHEFTAMRHYAARDVVEPALAALSAPPSQSESDDERLIEAMANEFVGHIAAGRSSHVAMRFTLAVARKAPAPSPTPYVRPADGTRDTLGRIVREAWIKWALTQPNPKPSWLVPYDELSEPDKEADRQIGEAVAASIGVRK